MTAGLWHQAMEVLGEGASESRPAVSIVWRLSTEAKPSQALLEMYEGPTGRSAVMELVGALGSRSLQRLEQALAQILGWGIKRLVLDFSRVTHLDTAACRRWSPCSGDTRGRGWASRWWG